MEKKDSFIKKHRWIIISYIINALWIAYFMFVSGYDFMPSSNLDKISEPLISHSFHSGELIFNGVALLFYKVLEDGDLINLTLGIMAAISTILALLMTKSWPKKKLDVLFVIISLIIQIFLGFLFFNLFCNFISVSV